MGMEDSGIVRDDGDGLAMVMAVAVEGSGAVTGQDLMLVAFSHGNLTITTQFMGQ